MRKVGGCLASEEHTPTCLRIKNSCVCARARLCVCERARVCPSIRLISNSLLSRFCLSLSLSLRFSFHVTQRKIIVLPVLLDPLHVSPLFPSLIASFGFHYCEINKNSYINLLNFQNKALNMSKKCESFKLM